MFPQHQLNDTLTLDFVVVYGNCCLTNLSLLNWELFDYNQKEADTRIVQHALDVSKNDPFTELVSACSDLTAQFSKPHTRSTT